MSPGAASSRLDLSGGAFAAPVLGDAMTIGPTIAATGPVTTRAGAPQVAAAGASAVAGSAAMPADAVTIMPNTVLPDMQSYNDAVTIAPGGPAVPPADGHALADAITIAPHTAHSAPDAVTNAPQAAASAPRQDTGPLEIGQAFGRRYHIIRMLGVGGMGAVYQAWDAELGVAVALKVIRPEVMKDPHAAAEVERRFKRELLLARQVTHKNVVRIHDIGDIGGIRYITMTYVEGHDLASRLKSGDMPRVPEIIRMARGVVSGLVAAHAAGVVHRDLKPANIMVDGEGEAVIMDFGIAHSTGETQKRAADSVAQPQHWRGMDYTAATMSGTIVGTIEYMAPEQARGEAIDQRVDVYAMGLILYDLILGKRRASHAKSAFEELDSRMVSPPPALKSLVPELPDALALLVSKCLEPDPANRFQTSAELEAALDRLDDEGVPHPIRRMVRLPLVAAMVALLLAGTAGTYWYQRSLIPPPAHDPVSVLIADLDNGTGDPAFSRTLEPMLKIALEEAGFISAIDRTQVRARLGVPPPEMFDAKAANEIAVKQGVGVVLTGSVVPQGNGYEVAVKAYEAVTGKPITEGRRRANGRDQVLAAATSLATDIREALGDDTSDSARRFATDTLSTTSLDVVRNYSLAMEAMADGKFEEALARAEQARKADTNFGLAYVTMASASRNLDRIKDAEQYALEAVRHVDGMTERERYRARGLVYMATGDYQQCLKEFGDMLGRYAADVVAYNNLAFCQTQLRDMTGAVNSMKRAAEILPKRALYRLNLALYAAYSSDFAAAEKEAGTTRQLGNALGLQPLAYAQVAQGRLADASQTYRLLAMVNPQGASIGNSGLADIPAYEGRFTEAIRLYSDGAAADEKQGSSERAAAKFAAIAFIQLQRGRKAAAAEAAHTALQGSQSVRTRLLAGRGLAQAGDTKGAQAVAAKLAAELPVDAQAAAKIIDGNVALENGRLPEAIRLLTESTELLNTWIGQFDLGRANLAASRFTQADSSFDRCLKRAGELFLDEEPSYAYLPAVYYYQGRAREAQKSAGFANSYLTYLKLRGNSTEDPLLAEVRKRAG